MIPFLILLGFFPQFYFPNSLISTEVFYLPKQQKVKIVAVSTACVSFLSHDSVVVASKPRRFQQVSEEFKSSV